MSPIETVVKALQARQREDMKVSLSFTPGDDPECPLFIHVMLWSEAGGEPTAFSVEDAELLEVAK